MQRKDTFPLSVQFREWAFDKDALEYVEKGWMSPDEAQEILAISSEYIDVRFTSLFLDVQESFKKRLHRDGHYNTILPDGCTIRGFFFECRRTWRTNTFSHIEDACVAWILCAREIGFHKDLSRLIARMLWATRYRVVWNSLLFQRVKDFDSSSTNFSVEGPSRGTHADMASGGAVRP